LYYDGDDYIVLSIVKDFFRFGVEPRHLTMYKHFAEREANFFETIVAPTLRQKNPDARRAASDALGELAMTSRKLKQALLRTNLRDHLQSA
ncbi:MAG: MerR family transcriptional regulator, partial [Actinobacteria bacterium]|nr:MerR family transcriptional regulator [Actinomycetota bacterium]